MNILLIKKNGYKYVAISVFYMIYPKYLATKIQNVRHNDDISVVATTTLDVSTPSCPIFLAII